MAGRTVRHVVVLGGGGFSEEPDNPLLDDFVLGLTAKRRPRVCFLPTASGDAPGYIERFHKAFPPKRAAASCLTLFRDCGVRNLRKFLLSQDVLYVGGGSTVNLLAVWHAHGVDRIVREAWQRGGILAGISAGMNCWFRESLTCARGGVPSPLRDGLAILAGSACPHYNDRRLYRTPYRRFVARGLLCDGIAAEDGVAVHFAGDKVAEAVSSRPGANAYRVTCQAGRAVEIPLETRCLASGGRGDCAPLRRSRTCSERGSLWKPS